MNEPPFKQRPDEKRAAGNLRFTGHGFTHSSELAPRGVSQVSGIEQVCHTRPASLTASRSVHLISIFDRPERRSPWRPAGWCGCLQPRRAPAQLTEQKYTRRFRLPPGSRLEGVPGVPGPSLLLAHTQTTALLVTMIQMDMMLVVQAKMLVNVRATRLS